ncbi:M13 family metallopeptidase [Undibacterium sp. CY7W]|uniref:M13 family metallopeptidase n=1 Tax=Undibacterium rugosum TaxID=2762291 RepID=A0A923I146_9BURK|nr:M13 family metallopeptidase [Undibacterium rugosum]MBC3935879.1 M13 family metallopeptidase [Undibacterium rugosum]
MKAQVLSVIALLIAGTTSSASSYAAEPAKAASPSVLLSGVDTKFQDKSVAPQDDFYRHVNGAWLKNAQIPSDRSSAGAFMDLREAVVPRLHTIIQGLSKGQNAQGSDAQKIADLFASFMDTKAIEAAGLKPLQADFAKIDAISDKNQLPATFAWLNRISVTAPFDVQVHQDNKDSTKYVLDIGQSGLALPDRDYYLKDDDAKLKATREKYLQHIEKMLSLAGNKDAAKKAAAILALETELAKVQWTKVELRDPIKAYNKIPLNELSKLGAGYDWNAYLKELGVSGKIDYVIVAQPSYITGMSKVLAETPLDTIKAYLKWHTFSSAASQLPKQFSDESFAFFSKTLRGVPSQEVRWKRGVRLVDSGMGESLGKLYVEKHFPADSKAKMEQLVNNLLLAYKQSVDTLDWMSDATKKEAQAKLATFMPKIGYPNKWKDYSELKIVKGDAVGNLRAIRQFAAQTELNKLGKPIDRDEWGMTPQTVNAYYNPEMNEIVFPAAILQAPFFNPKADDAVNYGGIGAVIGHEISHGFDDQGAQYDGLGNLRDWWTKEDHEKFAAKTAALVKQYNAFSPVSGYHVNGELTLGENIADNSGLAIAYKAYILSLGGKPAPVIGGLTGDQRFFMGFAQVWRGKLREQEAIIRIKTDPHSPGEFRANGTLRNMTPFYQSFGVKEANKMYLPPAERVTIW